MKSRPINILLILALLGAGATVLLLRALRPDQTTGAVQTQKAEKPFPAETPQSEPAGKPQKDVPFSLPAEPKPAPDEIAFSEPPVVVDTPKAKPTQKPQPKPQLTAEEHQRAEAQRYWDRMKQIFEQRLRQLAQEKDPARRRELIRQIAQNVRFDTLSTLDWAMGLTDEDERRMAMEALSKNALVGIGARIQMDETGFPSIAETTELSAVGSTGQVEPGDYIIGMDSGDGNPVYFDGMNLREIVQALRGDAGTEIRLLMQRPAEYAGAQPTTFDVPVTRSMIIMPPPQ